MVTERLLRQIIMIKYLLAALFVFNVGAKDINDFPKIIGKMKLYHNICFIEKTKNVKGLKWN